jgi:fermentation-respiration switch protein FrsA (DUF1100 family)
MAYSMMLSLAVLGQVVLPGSELSLEQAQEKADIIVVAIPDDNDYAILGSASSIFSMNLQESAVLKGHVDEKGLKKTSGHATGQEIVPKPGEEYIFFLNKYADHPNVLKVLPRTDENIGAVKEEILRPRSSLPMKGFFSRMSPGARHPSPRPTVVDRFLFHPDRYPVGNWAAGESKFEDAWFRSANGARLNGWFAEARRPRAVVLYAEGNAGNITNRRDVLTLFRDRLNTSVLVFDYQGYGKSEGTPTREGILDDARAARRWLAEKTGVAEKDIVLVGQSLGGSVAVDLAARDGARGLVLENTFSSLADVTRQHFGRLAGRLVTNQLDSASLIRDYQGPLLQSHGDADAVVPFDQGRRLFEAANEPKRFVAVPGGGHNDRPSPEYLEALDQFLDALSAQVRTR